MASPMSGRAGRQAAIETAKVAQQQLDATLPIYEQGWEQARGALTSAYQPSKNYIRQGFKAGRKDIKTGLTRGRQELGQGYGEAIGTLQDQYGQAQGAAQQGVGAWQENLNRANVGYDMYSDALGLNGAQGRADAQAAFQAGPGYQWGVDQATQQTQRAANRVGGLYGGNTQDATTRLSQNLANQEWGSWLGNLQGYQGAAGTATAGYAGQLNNLAQLYAGEGKDVATMQANRGKDLAGLTQWGADTNAKMAYGYGTDQASLRTNLGSGLASAATGRMQDIAGATNKMFDTVIGTIGPAFQAGQDAAKNRMGALTGGLQLGAGILGKAMGGGSFFGK